MEKYKKVIQNNKFIISTLKYNGKFELLNISLKIMKQLLIIFQFKDI